MKTIYYRRWEPAQSPVKIEFRPEVLQEMRASRKDTRGFLFGNREGDVLRVVTASAEPQEQLETLGVYISRIRGEVFLTDDDLEHAESVRDGIALVMAGRRAGFFTREADGSIQAIRSHEEFVVAEEPIASAPPVPHQRHPWLPPVKVWKRIALAAGMLAVPVTAMTYLEQRMLMPALDLTLRETNGQLILGWDRVAVADGARLEILEGDARSVISVANDSTGATYWPKTDDVEVRLKAGGRLGTVRWKASRYARWP